METQANALHGFGALFFWDVRLGRDHGVLVYLMIIGGHGTIDENFDIILLTS